MARTASDGGGSSRPRPTPQPGASPTPVKPKKTPAKPKPVQQGPPSRPNQPGFVTPHPTTTSTAAPAAPAPSRAAASTAPATPGNIPRNVYLAIIKAADENGVPRDLALAIAQHESGFNAQSVGDNGSSFGLYQLHQGGELTSAGLTPEQAYDPYTNASVALKVVGSVYKQHPNWSPGQIAAAAQRPADPSGYAASVNGILHSGTFQAVHAGSAGTATGAAGGGTAGGGAAAGGGSTLGTFTPNSTLSIDHYGFIKAVAESEPDLQKLMQQYAGQDLSDPNVAARLEAEIKDTHWYKTHTDGERSQEVLKATNPQQYKTKYTEAQKTMQDAAMHLGVTLNPESLQRLTKHYLAEGWGQNQVNQFLIQFGKHSGNTGDLGSTQSQLAEIAKQQMVPMSQQALASWAQKIMSGQVTQDAYTTYVKDQAKSLFPTLAASIDRGVSMESYADTYRTIAANTLNVDPQSIDFMNDPKYQKALYSVDPKTKERTPMGLADWGTYLRGLPEYAKTPQANQQAASMANSILTTLGKVAN